MVLVLFTGDGTESRLKSVSSLPMHIHGYIRIIVWKESTVSVNVFDLEFHCDDVTLKN